MVLLPVAAREVREASRQTRTYAWRWITAAVGLGLMSFVAWATRYSRSQGFELFVAVSTVAYIYCLIAGAVRTADVIAEEKRENTLGLLLLTDLKGWDIILGKLLSSSVNCLFGLLALLPLLAIPMLMGGVSAEQFWKVVLNLVNTLLLSISWGFLISCLFRVSVMTISTALALMIFIGGAIPIASIFLHEEMRWRHLSSLLFIFTPTHGHVFGLNPGVGGGPKDHYWLSLAIHHAFVWLNLRLAMAALPRFWQEVPKNKKTERWRERIRAWRFGKGHAKTKFRTQLLNQNPLYWLANRDRVSSPGLMIIAVSVLTFALFMGLAAMRGRWQIEPVMIGWFLGLLFVYVIVTFRMAMSASYRLAEDRRSGALELLLATEISIRELLRGYWMALGRQFFGPILIVLFSACFGISLLLLMFSEHIRVGNLFETAIEILARLFRGGADKDEGLAFVALSSVHLMLILNWIGVTWVGMWLGLRERRPGVATWITLTIVFVPPWVLLIGGAATLDEMGFFRNWSEEACIFTTLCAGWALGLGHLLWLILWARGNLRDRFREAAADRYMGPRRIPWPAIRRVTVRFAVAGACLVGLFYMVRTVIDRRGEKAWAQARAAFPNFQLEKERKPAAVIADDQNLAKAPLLVGFMAQRRNRQLITPNLAGAPAGMGEFSQWDWPQGRRRDLAKFEEVLVNQKVLTTNTAAPADSILRAFAKYNVQLEELRSEARARPQLQYTATAPSSQQPFEMPYPFVGPNPARTADIRPGISQLAQTVSFIASAQAAAKGAASADDLLLALRLIEGVKDIPNSEVHYLDMILSVTQGIYDAMSARAFSENDLVRLQQFFSTRDFWSGFDEFREDYIRQVLADSNRALAGRGNRNRREPWLTRQMPKGFVRQWQAEMINWGLNQLPKIVDAKSRRIDAAALSTLHLKRPESPMGRRYPDQVSMTIRGIGLLQTTADQIALACAIERFRLAHARLPQRLEELTPKYLLRIPHDVYTGDPLKYVVQTEDNYLIYSVGPDGADNHGITGQLTGSWTLWQDLAGTDLVWRSEPFEPVKRKKR